MEAPFSPMERAINREVDVTSVWEKMADTRAVSRITFAYAVKETRR